MGGGFAMAYKACLQVILSSSPIGPDIERVAKIHQPEARDWDRLLVSAACQGQIGWEFLCPADVTGKIGGTNANL